MPPGVVRAQNPLRSPRADERIVRLTELQEENRGARAMPARADFSLDGLRPWLGHRVILHAIEGGGDFRYLLFGSEPAKIFRFDLTGQRVSECVAQIDPLALQEYRDVYRSRQPLVASRLAHLVPDKEHATISKLALPLSPDGAAVDQILAAIFTNVDAADG